MSHSVETIVVADASVVINLLHVERLETMTRLLGTRFTLPEEVIAEVVHQEQRAALQAILDSGAIDRCSLDALSGSATLVELRDTLGLGELACLALAEQHGWTIAADERGRFKREALSRVGKDRLLRTQDLLLRAIRQQLMTVDEADKDKETLATKRCVMRFGSFRDLLTLNGEGVKHAE